MRVFKTSQLVQETITEGTWKFRLRLKDIFTLFQSTKINLAAAKKKIADRIKQFLNKEDLTDDVAKDIKELSDRISKEDNPEKIDDIVNALYDIADKHLILIK